MQRAIGGRNRPLMAPTAESPAMPEPMLTANAAVTQPPSQTAPQVGWADYLRVGLLLFAFSALLVIVKLLASVAEARPERLLLPVFAAVALTAIVWLLMVIVRNTSVMRGLVSPEYYVAYTSQPPAEWVERPARAFNNLMQVPTLFYVVCVLMLVTGAVDQAQLAYAWIFVAVRALHACVYIGWNHVAYRFTAWVASCIVLGALWTRFALQSWPGW
jgi:hypothetical protein